jgi:hypothetical protein
MDLTDPRAAGFNSDVVRDALEFAMKMGMPDNAAERVKFIFKAQHTYANEDPTGNPYEWSAPPTATISERREVEVPVAMEFISRTSQGRDTTMGHLLPSHVEIYILDTYIDDVRGADELMVDGNVYKITAWPPPHALFDFTLYPCLAEAVDES